MEQDVLARLLSREKKVGIRGVIFYDTKWHSLGFKQVKENYHDAAFWSIKVFHSMSCVVPGVSVSTYENLQEKMEHFFSTRTFIELWVLPSCRNINKYNNYKTDQPLEQRKNVCDDDQPFGGHSLKRGTLVRHSIAHSEMVKHKVHQQRSSTSMQGWTHPSTTVRCFPLCSADEMSFVSLILVAL